VLNFIAIDFQLYKIFKIMRLSFLAHSVFFQYSLRDSDSLIWLQCSRCRTRICGVINLEFSRYSKNWWDIALQLVDTDTAACSDVT